MMVATPPAVFATADDDMERYEMFRLAKEVQARNCLTPEVQTVEATSPVPSSEDYSECSSVATDEDDIEMAIDDVPYPKTLTEQLAPAIAELLSVYVKEGDSDASASPFHSEHLHRSSLEAYVTYVAQRSCLTVAPFVAALILIDRLDARGHDAAFSRTTIHKLFLTALSVAHKAVEEYQLRNSTTAAIGGVATAELKACEFEFVRLMDWELGISDETFQSYLSLLLRRADVSVEAVGNIGFLGH